MSSAISFTSADVQEQILPLLDDPSSASIHIRIAPILQNLIDSATNENLAVSLNSALSDLIEIIKLHPKRNEKVIAQIIVATEKLNQTHCFRILPAPVRALIFEQQPLSSASEQLNYIRRVPTASEQVYHLRSLALRFNKEKTPLKEIPFTVLKEIFPYLDHLDFTGINDNEIQQYLRIQPGIQSTQKTSLQAHHLDHEALAARISQCVHLDIKRATITRNAFNDHLSNLPQDAFLCLDSEVITSLNLSFDDVLALAPRIKALELINPPYNREQLKKLLESCSNLYQLRIKSDALPKLSAPSAKEVYADGCANLSKLSAPSAKKVYANGCTWLSELSAPSARVVQASGCAELSELSVPNAEHVFAWDCTRLSELSAPSAKEVQANGCTRLSKLSAPRAKVVHATGCAELSELSTPRAEAVYARGCTNLSKLSAPNAEIVIAKGCANLSELIVPESCDFVR